ncbi:MAG TPA: hypothetical protein VFX89_09455 [Gammaproteobacteria bacterium]|nr:hypothetical protein [Gammaproteobacteria bacterium]
MQSEQEQLREQAQKIERSGALGRSRSYARLLEFLVDCSLEGRTPKELEIAIEVFGKGADFDPSQDSMVRVYAHNLRQKLEHYYATEGRADARQLTLARGEYRISLTAADVKEAGAEGVPLAPALATAAPVPPLPPPPPRPEPRARLVVAAVSLLVLGVLLGVAIGAMRAPPPTAAQTVAASPVWQSVLDDDMPILVVVGDYYIFGEVDESGDVERLVRDFAVNSSKELDELMMYDPQLLGRYMDLDLTYLPRGSAFALLDVLRVLYTSSKPVRVVSMSELNMADLKTSHVVYLGFISALDKLEDFVFASSSLAVGYTYDELRDVNTGEMYTSEAGMPESNHNYRDYGFISTFPGPSGNQFVIISGTRDAGMMQAAHALSDPMFIKSLEQSRPDGGGAAPSFEMLYEVTGYARTNLDAMLVHTAKLDYQQIWGGNFLHGY